MYLTKIKKNAFLLSYAVFSKICDHLMEMVVMVGWLLHIIIILMNKIQTWIIISFMKLFRWINQGLIFSI